MTLNRSGKGFGKNKKGKKTKKHKYTHDGFFLFNVNHEIGAASIGFVNSSNLQKEIDELEANNFTMLIANPGCSLLLDELAKRMDTLAQKNLNHEIDSDLMFDALLQIFEHISRKMIMDEIYFPVPELAECRLRHPSVVQDRHPENNLISYLSKVNLK